MDVLDVGHVRGVCFRSEPAAGVPVTIGRPREEYNDSCFRALHLSYGHLGTHEGKCHGITSCCLLSFGRLWLGRAVLVTRPHVSKPCLVFCCLPTNDLYVALAHNRDVEWPRYEDPTQAIAAAPAGAGVLILADGYPSRTTALDEALFAAAAKKGLRLYVEFPSHLPRVQVGKPRATEWERAVIASEVFGPSLARLRILGIHDCHFVPVEATRAHIVVARVAGFDTAVYGLPQTSHPILFEPEGGHVLVATTKLSQFATARYAPTDAWAPIWRWILDWLQPGEPIDDPRWTPKVRPTFGQDERLSAGHERAALRRGIEWFFNARMLMHPSWVRTYDETARQWPERIGPMPARDLPAGDGSLGVLEGFNSAIAFDGTQRVRWWRRNDCNGETAGAMALAGAILDDEKYTRSAANIGDFLYTKSILSQDKRADPNDPAYGLIGWNDVTRYHGNLDGYGVYYADDNARSMLGMMAAASVLQTNRWDDRLACCLVANLRLAGQLGFQPDRVDEGPLEKNGWQHYFASRTISLSPHYQAYLWACHLWAYRQGGEGLFLDRAKTAIRMTMEAYPDRWRWTNGIQQERARMLLPLAWLVRVEDTAEHRGWLRSMTAELLAGQDACGAIREELGPPGKGGFAPPASNEAYGTNEASLIQANGDPVTDLLYTTNFAFLGLHEAASATGDSLYRDAEDKLAGFLCRIQIRSETHPELDGAWFRAFDYRRWEYWASSADAGWGAWSVETGWTQAWITSVLAMRQMKTSLWDITAGSGIRESIAEHRRAMLPDDVVRNAERRAQ